MKQTFGKVIGDVRQERGWSVYALARKAGLTDQAIHDLEGSDRMPTFDTARRLAAALGISLDWLASQLPPVELPEPGPQRPRGRPRKVEPQSPKRTRKAATGGSVQQKRSRKETGE
jgi:transcriptional regulator with XRE-family HTH domain